MSTTTFDQFLDAFQESDTLNRLLDEEADKSCHEEGMFGLSHGQMIDGWEEFLRDEITPENSIELADEIESVRKWHENNGTLDEVI